MIIGIDLGTTNSLIAVYTENGPQLIKNALGEYLTPSAVYLDRKKNVTVGQAAKDRLISGPGRAASRFKRRMGTSEHIEVGGRNFLPEDLSALVLRALKADAEAFLGERVTEAVISVPAYFNDIQRKATKNAAEIAGLNVARLVNEPTAAALAYGLHIKEDENSFLVVDLGGGTFDVTILEMFSGVMEVRASAGDAFLGGEDFTDEIVKVFLKQLGVSKDKLSSSEMGRLRASADKIKHQLTSDHAAKIKYKFNDQQVELELSRSQFEEICEPLVKRLRLPIQRAISDANLKPDEIDRIVLVGGATRMPIIRALMTRLFKRFPEHDLDPDHVIALGTAVQAGLIARHEALEEVVMTDVCPFTLGYETSRQIGPGDNYETGLFEPLIERNTTVPVSRSHTVYTIRKGQRGIEIRVFQGEAPFVKDNIKIGSYNVPVPFNRKENEAVEIRFTYDSSGILEVISKVLSTGDVSRLIVEKAPGQMSQAEIDARFKELDSIKIHPREEAENEALVSRLAALYESALGEKRQVIADFLLNFESALSSYDKNDIEEMKQHIIDSLPELEGDDFFE